MEKNRSHGKIDKLPDELKREVENRLLEGYTYQQISDYLKGMGQSVSKSAVHRYGEPFLKKFENVRMAKEFACLLAEDNVDRPTTELHEANNALVSQMIMEALVDENISAEKKLSAAKSIATLQRAQVANERLKIISRKEAGAVRVAMNMLKAKVFEEIQMNHPEIATAIVKIADDIEKEIESI